MPHRCGPPEVGNHKWYLTYTCAKNSTHFICVIVKWLATKSPFYFPSYYLEALDPQEFKLKADRQSVIIRAVGFTLLNLLREGS